MDGNLRAGRGAGWLQRTLVKHMLRVASASVLSLVALLVWRAAEPSATRALDVAEATTVSGTATQGGGSTVAARPLPNRKAAQSARVASRPQLLARSRATDGEGDTPPTLALASPPVATLGDVADSARARLRQLALGHAPYGEPSPFDATAPPTESPRNG